ncbi:MAG: nicotinate (nicotinamide) nucleotide adenylyltransferase [Spirochaetes bacterium]|nr:nicotinate (nicotinamide) nucleotide adenylyltransferase [Spirochaetota bacterium]
MGKVALFGGTFNPVHMGHLINAQFLINEMDINACIFIPARYPVHKSIEHAASEEDRFQMLMRAIEKNVNFEVSRIELDSDMPSYTVITLEKLVQKYSRDEIFLVIGADSYNQLSTWREYRKIFALSKIIVLRRPGDEIDKDRYAKDGGNFIFANNPLVGISSSYIRQLVSIGKSILYLVPDRVREYIIQRGLYTR